MMTMLCDGHHREQTRAGDNYAPANNCLKLLGMHFYYDKITIELNINKIKIIFVNMPILLKN